MVSAQQHRILRQVLQLDGCSRDSAQPLGDALHALYLARLLPVIEAACDALAAPGELLRIDKLEIDLGALPWAATADLPAVAAERLAAALPSRLAQAAQATPAQQSAAELLGHFACTGTLPWWADAADRQALAKAFEQVLAAPGAARELLRSLAGRADAWRRLLPHLGSTLGQIGLSADAGADARTDAALDRLLQCLHPGWPALAGARLAGLAAALALARRSAGDAQGRQSAAGPASPGPMAATNTAPNTAPNTDSAALARLRLHWWPPLLAGAGHGQAPAQLIALALDRLAQQHDIPAARLWQAWRAASDWQQPAAIPVAQALDGRWSVAVSGSQKVPTSGPASPQTLRQADATLSALLQSWADTPSGRALWGRLAGVLGQLPPSLRRAAGGADQAGGSAPDREARITALAALVGAASNQGLLAPEALQEGLQAAASQGGQGGQGAHASAAAVAARLHATHAAAHAATHAATPATTPDLADALFIDNAGLVLLWPFLGSFFERLGLVVGRSFTGDAAAQTGARLLHFLASGDPDPAEHQLPLCKLLCGLDLLAPIDPPDPLDPNPPLQAEQQAEAQALLAAVIAQASILGGLSADGLRGSFLLRRGQLSAVDGHHLLRVERESWDIVLGRLPWSTGFVKLPWMAALLQVQW